MESKYHILLKYYLKISVFILLFSGIVKIFFTFQEDRILTVIHPLFSFTTFRQVFGLTAILEIIIALTVLLTKDELIKIFSIMWIATIFAIYRGVMRYIGYRGPCGCFGNIKQLINVADYIGIIFIIIMLFGGFIMLFLALNKKEQCNIAK
jgi:hypothetical protein